MIVVSRQSNQTVVIGDHLRVFVRRCRGDSVNVAFMFQFGGERLTQSTERIMRRDDIFEMSPEVKVTVLDVRADRAVLGIIVSKEIQVHRGEVYDALKKGGRLPE